MEESQDPRPGDGPPELWTPTADVAAEVGAAVAAAGEVVAEFTLAGESDPGSAGAETHLVLTVPDPADAVTQLVPAVSAVPTTPAVPAQSAAVEETSAPDATPTIAIPTVGGAAAEPAPPPESAPTVAIPVLSTATPVAAPAPALPTFGTPAPPAAADSPTPDQISRHIARAEALAELGRRQQALDVLNELIVAGAEDVRIWRALATVYLETGDGEKALRAADWVVTFAPGDEWGYRLRANALRLLDRPEEAVTAATEAVRLGPDVWQGRAALAMALHSTGDMSAAAAEARKATDMAEKADPELAPEARQVEAVVKDAEQIVEGLESLEAVLAGPPGADDAGLEHVGGLVLRGLEFSAVAGWAVSFGGVAIGNYKLRLLIPLAVLLVLGVFLFRPARKAGRDLWRYLVEYLWQDPKTRSALLMAVAAHVWMIAGSSVGHVQGGSALILGLITHLTGRTVLAKKAPELNPIKRPAPARTPESAR